MQLKQLARVVLVLSPLLGPCVGCVLTSYRHSDTQRVNRLQLSCVGCEGWAMSQRQNGESGCLGAQAYRTPQHATSLWSDATVTYSDDRRSLYALIVQGHTDEVLDVAYDASGSKFISAR